MTSRVRGKLLALLKAQILLLLNELPEKGKDVRGKASRQAPVSIQSSDHAGKRDREPRLPTRGKASEGSRLKKAYITKRALTVVLFSSPEPGISGGKVFQEDDSDARLRRSWDRDPGRGEMSIDPIGHYAERSSRISISLKRSALGALPACPAFIPITRTRPCGRLRTCPDGAEVLMTERARTGGVRHTLVYTRISQQRKHLEKLLAQKKKAKSR